jgi:class 3 adenylate cyclase
MTELDEAQGERDATGRGGRARARLRCRRPSRPVHYTEPAVRAILFTDFCGSTRLTHELGDEGFMGVLRDHDEIVRSVLASRGGREVKHTGDGIMASFSSVCAAVQSGIDIQQSVRDRNETANTAMHLRVGVSVGEPVRENADLFGAAVQLSARLCEVAPPDGIAVSNAVRELCIGKQYRFDSRGDLALKGFPEPVPVFEVRQPAEQAVPAVA